VVTYHAGEEEMKVLREHGRVARLPAKINAAGNVILTNDSAALVHPGLSARACHAVTETLGVKVVKGTIGGLKTVGMAAVATNKGLLVHPRVSEAEVAVLEDLFELPVDVGTVNFGTPLVGSGLLANSQGYIAGDETTGPELGRIEDVLDFPL
jgi:translation initiation factor 6